MKPAPENIQQLYLDSLYELGINPREHDIRFVEDDWESPTLGAWGLGWEVWVDGMEVSQFTYFQQCGGFDLNPIPVELTYGLERITQYLTGIDNVFDLEWGHGVSYRDVAHRQEVEFSTYNFELADVSLHLDLFNKYEAECLRLLEHGLALPAYDCMKAAMPSTSLMPAAPSRFPSARLMVGRVRAMASCATAG